MSDIVPGLRRLPEPQCSRCYAAVDEIERLGRLVRLQDAEIARLRLTDAEREAISAAACICEDAGRTDIAVIINTALERLG